MIDLSESRIYEFDEFRLDGKNHRLFRRASGELVPLSPKAAELLLILVQSGGRILTKEELLDTVWGNSFVEEANLSQTIFVLRKTLGENTKEPRFILTAPNRGYQFIASVNEVNSDDQILEDSFLSDVDQPSEARVGEREGPFLKSGRRKRIDSLAVLPFANASDDPSLEYLSDGITDTIINSLSGLPGLRVLARSTVFRYKGRDAQLAEIGSELRARAVVTGRVLRVGERLIVAVELVDVADEAQLWGERFNRELSDIFEVQEEIAHEISEALKLKLTSKQKKKLAKQYTESTDAYHLYLKGRHHWNKRTEESLRKSIEFFDLAIKSDPNYALAFAGLADAYTKLGDVGVTAISPRDAFSKGRAAAERALEIDNTLAEIHASLAHLNMHHYQWQDAERQFKRAIELDPNYTTAHHWYAYYLMFNGRVRESLAEITRTIDLDPLSPVLIESLGQLFYFARRYDNAIEQHRQSLDIDPHYFPAHIGLARAFEQKKLYDEAFTEIERAMALSPDSMDILASLGHMYAVSEQTEKALGVLAKLNERSQTKHVSPYNIAVVYVGLGERDEALEWLNKAHLEQSEGMIYLTIDPRLDPLHSDPRFTDLAHLIGLPSI